MTVQSKNRTLHHLLPITGIGEEYDSLQNKCIKSQSLNTFAKPSTIDYIKLTD